MTAIVHYTSAGATAEWLKAMADMAHESPRHAFRPSDCFIGCPEDFRDEAPAEPYQVARRI